ncbi:MAG: hypothetical protein WBJ62_01675 [Coriobacteriia bacterium]
MIPQTTDQLTESHVVDIVCARLESLGWEVTQKLTTTQTGDDIIASRGDRRICVEAKGATSARENSERFGTPFNSAQVRVHVAEAVYKCLQVLSREPAEHAVLAGLALPANQVHKAQLASVEPMLERLGVAVFWVSIEAEIHILNWDPSA